MSYPARAEGLVNRTILFSCYLSIWHLYYVPLFSYFALELFCFLCTRSSSYFLQRLIGRNFFRYFGRYCLIRSWYLLNLPSFSNSFWFISCCIVSLFYCYIFSIFSFSCVFLYFPCPVLFLFTQPPPLGQDMTQGQFFKRSLTGLNSDFSFS